jgi:CubicO group peptidase (beta-lactamase class C family)
MGDLASMASGLDWNENYDNLLTITPRTYVEKDMGKLMQTIPIVDPPGKNFIYQSGSTQLLAMALEKATGKNISELIWAYYWNPIGAEQEAYWQIDSQKAGLEKAYCCFNSNARDFARFGKLFKNHGKWNGTQIIDSAFVAKAVNPRFSESPQYGYGWWLGEVAEKPYFSMRGHLGQYVIVFPEQDVIVVRLGHRHLDDLPGQQVPADLPIYVQETFQMLSLNDES